MVSKLWFQHVKSIVNIYWIFSSVCCLTCCCFQPAVRHEACNGLYKLSLSGLEGGESINRSFLLLAASTLLKFLPDAQALKPLRVSPTYTQATKAAKVGLHKSCTLVQKSFHALVTLLECSPQINVHLSPESRISVKLQSVPCLTIDSVFIGQLHNSVIAKIIGLYRGIWCWCCCVWCHASHVSFESAMLARCIKRHTGAGGPRFSADLQASHQFDAETESLCEKGFSKNFVKGRHFNNKRLQVPASKQKALSWHSGCRWFVTIFRSCSEAVDKM